MTDTFRTLRSLGLGQRLGLSFLLLVFLGGLVASAAHLVLHHQGRDGVPGLSLADIEGVYTGVKTEAPMRVALERGHPEGLDPAQREVLLEWLRGDRISEDYDSLDLGEAAPAEVIDAACLRCHARGASEGEGIGDEVPLEYWDDIEKVAYSREIEPLPTEIVVASTHTHALSMAWIGIVLVLLLGRTRFSRAPAGALSLGLGLGLALDLGGWWLARFSGAWAPAVAVGGALFGVSAALAALLVLAELWLPARRP